MAKLKWMVSRNLESCKVRQRQRRIKYVQCLNANIGARALGLRRCSLSAIAKQQSRYTISKTRCPGCAYIQLQACVCIQRQRQIDHHRVRIKTARTDNHNQTNNALAHMSNMACARALLHTACQFTTKTKNTATTN